MFVVQAIISDSLAWHYRKLIRLGVHPAGRKVSDDERTHMQAALDTRKDVLDARKFAKLEAVQQTHSEDIHAQHNWSKTMVTAHNALEQRVAVLEAKKVRTPTVKAKAAAKVAEAKAKAKAKAEANVVKARIQLALAEEAARAIDV
jgi:hypothetical protein